jgi:dolichol-phosphate mannosyltransferase
VLEAIDFETVPALGYAFQIETTFRALRAGFRVVEVPIVFRDRRVGESKMSGAIVVEAALRVPAMRLDSRRR